jgi:hypothetical protein
MTLPPKDKSQWGKYHLRETIRELSAAEGHLVASEDTELVKKIREIRKKLEEKI